VNIFEQVKLINTIATSKDLESRQQEIGKVTRVNNNDTANVLITTRSYSLIQCRLIMGLSVEVGNSVIVAYPMNADKNYPYIIARSDLEYPDEEEVSIKDVPEDVGGLCLIHYYDEKLYIYDNTLTETANFSFLESFDSELTYIGRDSDGNFYLKDENSSFDLVKYNRDFSVRTEI